jgi:hypothetical protein
LQPQPTKQFADTLSLATPNSLIFDGQLADFGFESDSPQRQRNQQLRNKVEEYLRNENNFTCYAGGEQCERRPGFKMCGSTLYLRSNALE